MNHYQLIAHGQTSGWNPSANEVNGKTSTGCSRWKSLHRQVTSMSSRRSCRTLSSTRPAPGRTDSLQLGGSVTAVRVSLRTETLFVDVLEHRAGSGVALSFRTRRGRSDLTGGGENHVALTQLETPSGYRAMLDGLRLAGGIDSKCGGRR